jgi:hypothetical protein
MHKLPLVAIAVLAMQGTFEGTVTYQVTTKSGKTVLFDYSAKGNKVVLQPRDSSPAMFGAMIVDLDTKTQTVVVPSRKMYMTMPMTDDNAAAARMDSTMKNVKMVKVGSETVAGVPCDDYATVGGTGNDSGTVCIAHGMGNWVVMGMGASPLAMMEQRIKGLSAAASGGFFPIKWSGRDGDSMVAVKIEQKHIDPATFTPPAGYTAMQMPAGAMSRMNGGTNKP